MWYWTILPSDPVVALALGERVARTIAVLALGVLFFLAIAVQFLKVRALYGSDDPTGHEDLTNCPSCGARTPGDADACQYCGEAIDGEPR